MHTELEAERSAQVCDWELFDAQRLQMESTTIKHFRACTGHTVELSEYTIVAFVECINDIIKLMIDRGIEGAIPILIEAKNSYGPLHPHLRPLK